MSPAISLGARRLVDAYTPESTRRFALDLDFCSSCALLQLREPVAPELLYQGDYRYLSSVSRSVVDNAGRRLAHAEQVHGLRPGAEIVEIASNDGYFLAQAQTRGYRVRGVDPAPLPVARARSRGVATEACFFDLARAEMLAEAARAQLLVAANVLAHCPDLQGTVAGFRRLLAADGVLVVEVPWLVELVEGRLFDTLYHDHVYHFSIQALENLLARHQLKIVELRRIDLHGGSLQLWIKHMGAASHARPCPNLPVLRAREAALGLGLAPCWEGFAKSVIADIARIRGGIEALHREGAVIACYGAAAKGALLLDCLELPMGYFEFVVDANPNKQGQSMPGCGLSIHGLSRLRDPSLTHLMVLAWNHSREILAQAEVEAFRARGGRCILPLPSWRVIG